MERNWDSMPAMQGWRMSVPKSQPLAPKGGNDRIYTPPELALAIVRHFSPSGRALEPCRGKGAFTDALDKIDGLFWTWMEIDDGTDFLTSKFLIPGEKFDWIITNPPWSKFRPFLNRAMEFSDNVVFLCLVNAWFMKARWRDVQQAGFGMKEILMVDTPAPPWPQAGFQLGAGHIQRGWTGPCTFSKL